MSKLVCIKNAQTGEVLRVQKEVADVLKTKMNFAFCNKSVYKSYLKSLINK